MQETSSSAQMAVEAPSASGVSPKKPGLQMCCSVPNGNEDDEHHAFTVLVLDPPENEAHSSGKIPPLRFPAAGSD
ncbi:hypothetical protein CSUB01_01969 [Colletotrichum sublineola]|uniref:Uncharacterized protein n=1 Tax=Colletotrichum sublineola TaxID=1173701 RepID=A0A066X2Y8_COLSU|nr:hypothetical protein CSUB01_01969 [Colletotrichum sublineola]